MNWVEEVCKSFRALANSQELAYLCITAKPEAAIRDKVTWNLQAIHPNLYICREHTSSSKELEKSKRLDFAIYSPDGSSPLIAFEAKAMLFRDLYWGLYEHEKGKWLHSAFDGIRDDIVNAKLACPNGSVTYGLLFLWQVHSDSHTADELSKMGGYLKYSGEHAESVRRGEYKTYTGDLLRAFEIAGLRQIAIEEIESTGPHRLKVKLTMAVLDRVEETIRV